MSERADAPADIPEEEEGWPVGFMIVVALAALYIGWRLIQLIALGIDWLF
jgi:hypothetical protein